MIVVWIRGTVVGMKIDVGSRYILEREAVGFSDISDVKTLGLSSWV